MKTDAEYLTEHVMGGYFCPCAPKPRRAQKQYVPGSGRHVHANDEAVHVCVAKELTRKIRHDLRYYPLLDLLPQIVAQNGLPAELGALKRSAWISTLQERLTTILVLLSKKYNLNRAKNPAELARASRIFSVETMAAEKEHMRTAPSWPTEFDSVVRAGALSLDFRA